MLQLAVRWLIIPVRLRVQFSNTLMTCKWRPIHLGKSCVVSAELLRRLIAC